MQWQNNRKVQFAVGVTVIVLAIRWLLTGDLLYAVEAAQPPAEGEVKSISFLNALWPLLVETCVIVGSSVIAWALGIWSRVVDLFDGDGQTPPTPVVEPATGLSKDKILELGRAAVSGDSVRVAELVKEIRTPHIIAAEMQEAVIAGNLARIKELTSELELRPREA